MASEVSFSPASCSNEPTNLFKHVLDRGTFIRSRTTNIERIARPNPRRSPSLLAGPIPGCLDASGRGRDEYGGNRRGSEFDGRKR